MDWVIRTGPNGAIPMASAIEIVVSRLDYCLEHPHVNPERMIAEALDYAKHVRRWVRANEPPPPPRTIERDSTGKPGPMSDG